MIREKNREGSSVFIYLHPREIDIHQPRLELGLMDGYFHYQGVAGCEEKLSTLLGEFHPTLMRMDAYAKIVAADEISV